MMSELGTDQRKARMKTVSLRLVFVVFYSSFALAFFGVILPLVSDSYGAFAGTVAALLFASFALGCGYFGRLLWGTQHHLPNKGRATGSPRRGNGAIP